MTKLSFNCCKPECNKMFERYASQVRNSDGVYCSRECKSEHQRETMSGEKNPNYRDGNTLNVTCACGKFKDMRANQCSECSRRGFSIETKQGAAQSIDLEIVLTAIENSTSLLKAAELLGVSRHSVTALVIKHNIDVSHMRAARGREKPFEEYFVLSNKRINNTLIKLIKKNDLIPHDNCSECGQGKVWNEKVLTLELDHINGDCYDNRLENLRFLCPNCHTQTPTSRGRNSRKKAGDAT